MIFPTPPRRIPISIAARWLLAQARTNALDRIRSSRAERRRLSLVRELDSDSRKREMIVAMLATKVSLYLGRRWPCPPGDPCLVASLQRTGQPLRIDDYTQIRSVITEPARELGIGMAAGVPVIVGGRVWGAVVVAANVVAAVRLLTISSAGGTVVISAAQQNDVAAPLQLGVVNGGLEINRW
jgi:GAF domain-containing protein